MELHSYIAQVQEQLETAAALGDERTQQTAVALATAAAPAMRLAILAAVCAAADEITEALLDSPGAPSVAVGLDGDAVRIEVRASVEQSAVPADDGDISARISLRLSETLKTDIEDAARRPQWGPGGRFADPRRHGGPGRGGNSHHVTGWING
jgi:hypothetical protein